VLDEALAKGDAFAKRPLAPGAKVDRDALRAELLKERMAGGAA
jgi:hypothetical protein